MATSIELSTHELQGLCQRYLKDDLTQTKQRNFQVISYELKPASDAPAGFLGRHQFLSVNISVKDGNDVERVEQLHFFTKSAPTDISTRMEYLEEFGVFKKEILVYRDVLPQLQKIYTEFSPRCYYADNNLLIFENLTKQGYKMSAGRDGLLNYKHLNCMLKCLAAMHASSIVYEVREGRTMLEMFPEALAENAYPVGIQDEHVRSQNFNNAVLVLKEIIKQLPKYQKNLEFILQHVPKHMKAIFTLAQVSQKYKNIFLHGDLWANNVMYEYGKFGESPIQARLVDFQLARYAPAMLDVITILTIPTSHRFREEHLLELVTDYYHFLSEFLKRESITLEHLMPAKEFFASIDEFRIAGLVESFLFSHLTILPPESTQLLTSTEEGFQDFFKSKRIEICMEAFNRDQIYRERLTDMTEDIVDNFVLKNN